MRSNTKDDYLTGSEMTCISSSDQFHILALHVFHFEGDSQRCSVDHLDRKFPGHSLRYVVA